MCFKETASTKKGAFTLEREYLNHAQQYPTGQTGIKQIELDWNYAKGSVLIWPALVKMQCKNKYNPIFFPVHYLGYGIYVTTPEDLRYKCGKQGVSIVTTITGHKLSTSA